MVSNKLDTDKVNRGSYFKNLTPTKSDASLCMDFSITGHGISMNLIERWAYFDDPKVPLVEILLTILPYFLNTSHQYLFLRG